MRALVLASLVLVGCGGSTAEFVGPTDETGAEGGADGSVVDTGSPADGATTDSTTPTDGTVVDTGATPTDTGVAPTDTGTIPTDAAIKCGTAVCTGGDICCATGSGTSITYSCAKTCGDGGVALSCTGPGDCSDGSVCCGTADLVGSGFACSFKSGSAACTTSCKTVLPTGCPGKATLQLCGKKSDCKDPSYPLCCTFSGGGASTTACVNSTFSAFGKCL